MKVETVFAPVGDDPPKATLLYGADVRDTLKTIPDKSVQVICTSPPYWGLRDYGVQPTIWGGDEKCDHDWEETFCRKCGAWMGTLGQEPHPKDFAAHVVEIMEEARRVLRDDGTLWLNLGDTYAANKSCQVPSTKWGAAAPQLAGKMSVPEGFKPKDLVGVPWRVAFALQDKGWWLRSDIIWSKPNGLPESVTDRPTKAHEYVFLFTKKPHYFYDPEAIRERQNDSSGHSRRSVWPVLTQPFEGAHFATWPPDLVRLMVKAGSSEKGCCPTCGAPWKRVVRRGEEPEFRYLNTKAERDANQVPNQPVKKRLPQKIKTRNTLGWEPTCNCPAADPVRCAVMDIFSGSGTTGMVALQENRNYIGIDLNEQYLEMAKARITGERAPSKSSDQSNGVLDLFSEKP
jgi:DNA modification methylase